MSQILKRRKLKKATVLTRKPLKSISLKSYFRRQSYKPLCEKLKNNNNSLAKALSKEKEEAQLLFSQNVALIAEVQDLGLACSKRDAVISSVLKNAKETLNMLVKMTGYVTNTISTCQEFTSSIANLRMSCNSAGKRDSYKRSTKSPTKGIVKPMVGGHTITKPTINLSRVNVRHINNPSNLSAIQEVATPPRNQELNNSRSPTAAVSVRQRRYEPGRACRMPERLTVVSPRTSGENDRRLSKRSSRHSGRMSGKHSRLKSDRLSGSNISRRTYSIDNLERIGSPTVKLNDVSKLLQNSQSINIRMLTESRNDEEVVSPDNGDNAGRENSQPDVTTIPESIANWEDPLEGPSWLFNDTQSVPCSTNDEEKTDDVDALSDSSTCKTAKLTDPSNASDSEECMQINLQSLPGLNKTRDHTRDSKKNKRINSRKKCRTDEKNRNNDSPCNTPTSVAATNGNRFKDENGPVSNSANFITRRRVYFEDEDEDDFTLMYTPQPSNMHFDINDLKLPVIDESALKSAHLVEPEPEITTTLRKISQICPVPSVSNNSLDESSFHQLTVKLPVLMNNDYDTNDLTPLNDKSKSSYSRKRLKRVSLRTSNEFIDNSPIYTKKVNHTKKKSQSVNKDPSTAKVVLQKLNESDVKSRTPSPEETSRNSNSPLSTIFIRTGNSSDSDSSNTSIDSALALNRPRRKRAPRNMQEPSLRKKLRRNH